MVFFKKKKFGFQFSSLIHGFQNPSNFCYGTSVLHVILFQKKSLEYCFEISIKLISWFVGYHWSQMQSKIQKIHCSWTHSKILPIVEKIIKRIFLNCSKKKVLLTFSKNRNFTNLLNSLKLSPKEQGDVGEFFEKITKKIEDELGVELPFKVLETIQTEESTNQQNSNYLGIPNLVIYFPFLKLI